MYKYAKDSSHALLWQFKMVINSGDLRYLLKIENYDDLPDDVDYAELSNAWYKIYNEFSDIAGGNGADLFIVKKKRLIAMHLQHDLHAKIINTIQRYPYPEMIEIAKDFGYNIDTNDPIEGIEAAKRKLIHLRHKITAIEKDSEPEEKKEKQNLDELITSLEKFQGYQFDEQKMTVSKFAYIYKKMKDAGRKDNI